MLTLSLVPSNIFSSEDIASSALQEKSVDAFWVSGKLSDLEYAHPECRS